MILKEVESRMEVDRNGTVAVPFGNVLFKGLTEWNWSKSTPERGLAPKKGSDIHIEKPFDHDFDFGEEKGVHYVDIEFKIKSDVYKKFLNNPIAGLIQFHGKSYCFGAEWKGDKWTTSLNKFRCYKHELRKGITIIKGRHKVDGDQDIFDVMAAFVKNSAEEISVESATPTDTSETK